MIGINIRRVKKETYRWLNFITFFVAFTHEKTALPSFPAGVAGMW